MENRENNTVKRFRFFIHCMFLELIDQGEWDIETFSTYELRNFIQTGWKAVYWNHLSVDLVWWWTVVNTVGWSRWSSIPTTWTGRMADLESVIETSHLLPPAYLACLRPFWGPNIFPIIFLQNPPPPTHTHVMVDVSLRPPVSSHTSCDSAL